MSDSEAASHTRTLMDMRETGQSMFIAYVADGKVTEHKDYVYERWQKELLIEAYTPLVQQSGIKVNPWLKVAYAEAVSSGPLVALMLKNRNNRITIEQQARKIAELNRKLAEKGEEPVKQLERKDTVRGWKINAKGEFTHSKDGEYIKDGNPREKAVLTAENYPYFVKYNSKELVHRVFNIPK